MLDFLGIGAQKAGTTWLYENLASHPGIRFPAGKEIHFWDRRGGRDVEEWLGLFSDSTPGLLQGEVTPAYALLDRSTIQEVHRCRPELRIFYSVRNPIERAWSGAMMALARAELEEHEVSDQWFIDHFLSSGSRRRGDYSGALNRWSSVFEAEQIKVILFDDIVARPRVVLSELARHIGADESFFEGVSDEVLRRPVRPGDGVPIRRTLLRVLQEQYDDEIDVLAKMIGRDLRNWRRGPTET